MLSPGELAYSAGDPFGANIYANCDFAVLRDYNCGLSNSFAVPVVAAYVNDLINRGNSRQEIESKLRNLKPYPISHESTIKPPWPLPSTDREIPVVYLANGTTDMCRTIMDCLYANHEVQSSALSLLECPHDIRDIRIKTVKSIDAIRNDLSFMERHYKTDIIFVLGDESQQDKVRETIDIDILINRRSKGGTLISYEGGQVLEPDQKVANRIHDILTM